MAPSSRGTSQPPISASFCATRGSSSAIFLAPSSTSDRSIVLTLMPLASSSFSL